MIGCGDAGSRLSAADGCVGTAVNNTRLHPLARWLARLVVLAGALLLLSGATAAPDALRRADALFAAGRYHAALAAYRDLARTAPHDPLPAARRGMVETVRGESEAAGRSLGFAIGRGLGGRDHDLARLYQGRAAAWAGKRGQAAQFWGTIGAASPLYPYRRVLEAESLLRAGEYPAAEAAYRAALDAGLPAAWRAQARTRLAALVAARDQAAARALLAEGDAPPPPPGGLLPRLLAWLAPEGDEPLAAPLLPRARPDAAQLAAALAAPPDVRPQLLGQLYLDAGMYALAEAQFAVVPGDSPAALAARAYAAYTRWLAGDRAGSIARLEALAASHPEEPRPRALLALTYLAGAEAERARQQLQTIQTMAPRAPDTHLAWAQWYAAHGDYLAAGDAYRQALRDAAPEQRGPYALAAAEFHLVAGAQLCNEGAPAAETAARLLPGRPRPLIVLAAARLRCGDPAGAHAAAAAALQLDPGSAEASYQLGRALAALGERAAARAAFVGAADLAPDTAWRERAETQIQALGL